MTAWLLRAIGRIVGFAILLALGLALLAFGATLLAGPGAQADVADSARLADALFDVRAAASDLASGQAAGWLAPAAAGALLLWLALLAAVLTPDRDRLVALAGREDGAITVRRRALRSAARALADRERDADRPRARLRGRRRLTVAVRRPVSVEGRTVETRVREALTPLSEAFGLRLRVTSAVRRRKARAA